MGNRKNPTARKTVEPEHETFPPGSVEAEIEELARKVPDRELAKLPRDLSANLDHYLYGAPGRLMAKRGRL